MFIHDCLFVYDCVYMLELTCNALHGHAKWYQTGTPIHNFIVDLYSCVCFLHYSPWCQWDIWKSKFDMKKDEKKVWMRLRTMLAPITLRRTKTDKLPDGSSLLVLPSQTSYLHRLDMLDIERKIYNKLIKLYREKLTNNNNEKISFSSLLVHLLRLRQCCDHIVLALCHSSHDTTLINICKECGVEWKEHDDDDEEKEEEKEIKDNANQQDEADDILCILCQDVVSGPAIIKLSCQHIGCIECIDNWLEQDEDELICTICDTNHSAASIQKQVDSYYKTQKEKKTAVTSSNKHLPINRYGHYLESLRISSPTQSFFITIKLQFLIQQLTQLKYTNPNDKILIFSQWTSMLDLIASALEHPDHYINDTFIQSIIDKENEKGKDEKINEDTDKDKKGKTKNKANSSNDLSFDYVRLDGSQTSKQQANNIELFHNNNKYNIFLLSLKAGGTGLNLTIANHIFMLDMWWNR